MQPQSFQKTVNVAYCNFAEKQTLQLDVSALSSQERVLSVAVLPFAVANSSALADTDTLYVLFVQYASECFVTPLGKYHLQLVRTRDGFSGSEYPFASPPHLQTSITLKFFDDGFTEVSPRARSIPLDAAASSVDGTTLEVAPGTLDASDASKGFIVAQGPTRIRATVLGPTTLEGPAFAEIRRESTLDTIAIDNGTVAQVPGGGEVILADYWLRPDLIELFASPRVRDGTRLKKKIKDRHLRVARVVQDHFVSLTAVADLVTMSFQLKTRSLTDQH